MMQDENKHIHEHLVSWVNIIMSVRQSLESFFLACHLLHQLFTVIERQNDVFFTVANEYRLINFWGSVNWLFNVQEVNSVFFFYDY